MQIGAAPIEWQTEYPTVLAQAKTDRRIVLVYFHKPN